MLALLPAGIVGGFGPELRRFVPALHAQGQAPTERRVALLNGIGVEISKRQAARMLTGPLDDLMAEDQKALRAGLATARWMTVDDTAARHARKDRIATQAGDERSAVFRTGASTSRETFPSLLRAGHAECVVNPAALDSMRGHGLSGQVVARLDAHPARLFADASAWAAHLARLGTPREWAPANGAWGAPKPSERFDPRNGRFGSVEVGARYSTLNLNSADVRGGQERIWLAIVNWRPIEPLRFGLQYEHANVDGGSAPIRCGRRPGRIPVLTMFPRRRFTMEKPSRRSMISATLGAAALFAAASATAQTPEPARSGLGANIIRPRNIPVERQNPDTLAPPRMAKVWNNYSETAARPHERPGREIRPESFTMDFHAHVGVPEATALAQPHVGMSKIAIVRFQSPETQAVNEKQQQDLKTRMIAFTDRLADLDQKGIDKQLILPAPPQTFYAVPLDIAVQSARLVNDGLAEFASREPNRFIPFCTVPMPDGNEAAKELERCMTQHGMKGVQVLTNVNGKELSHAEFAPFWRKAEELGALVVIHPNGFTDAERLKPFYLNNVIGNPLETTTALH